ncbi:hypothetical protein OHB07_22950 [Streptomyces sp. NBC_00111]|nr:hypothetical protein [Streptomyces sp. NBC_01460]
MPSLIRLGGGIGVSGIHHNKIKLDSPFPIEADLTEIYNRGR